MRIDQIINGPDEGPGVGNRLQQNSAPTSLGLLTKTLAGSPVVRWILPGRIRHSQKDDLIFVGEDFIHIKEISEEGQLHHVATKADFGCRIMSAKVLGNVDNFDGLENDRKGQIKVEDHEMSDEVPSKVKLPPQMLILALDTQQLVFMFACEDSSGNITFDMASSIPLPAFPLAYQQLGKHLAVDPMSRAIAVAAAQDHVYIYSGKPIERLHNGTATWENGFLPISSERPLMKIPGVILLMDFLYPPNNDPDQIILLLVVMKDRRITLRRIEWLYSSDVHQTQIHPPQKLSKDHPLPTLLIPVESNNAAFFLLSTASDTLYLYEDILSGLAVDRHLMVPYQPPRYPCTSSNMPVWIAWARPRRACRSDRTDDSIYLASEDGWVYYIVLQKHQPSRGATANYISHLGCNVDSAFTCYGNSMQPDIFAVGGDMSEGGVHKVTLPAVTRTVGRVLAESSQVLIASKDGIGSETMAVFPNWTPTFDIIASTLPRAQERTARTRDSLFAPGNRQPHGKLSELRFGLQARIDPETQFSAEELASTDRLWTLPSGREGDLRLLLSRPTESKLMSIPAVTGDTTEIYFVDADGDDGLDMRHRTLAIAAVGQDSTLVQITENGIFIVTSELQNTFTQRCPPSSRVVAADIAVVEGNQAVAITATRTQSRTQLYIFRIDLNHGSDTVNSIGEPVELDSEVLGMALCTNAPASFAVVSTADSTIHFFAASPHLGLVSLSQHRLPDSKGPLNACEDVLILSDDTQPASAPSHDLMVLCGLRNGEICAFGLRSQRTDTHPISITFQNYITIGLTTVRLRRDHSSTGCNAFATSGQDLFGLKWDGAGSQNLKISEVWLTNAADPKFSQNPVAAFACVPGLDAYPSRFSYALVIISGEDGFITNVEDDVKIVPRVLPLKGTPNRAMYASRLGCFVTASTKITPRQPFALDPKDPSRVSYKARCIQSIIEFSMPGTEPVAYEYFTEPGARVFAMTEWAYKNAGKEYAFIAVASGPIDPTSPVKGELSLLQPILGKVRLKDGSSITAIIDVRKQKTLAKFERQDQVTAIAAYGAHDLVACVENWLYLYRFLPEQIKFEEVCKYRFTSPGVQITTAPPLIHVTTANDSLITLHLTEPPVTGLANATSSGCHFRPIGMDSKYHKGIHHLTLTVPPSTDPLSSTVITQSITLNIMSTRDCKLLGYASPSPTTRTHTNAVNTLFSATLSRSQIRIRKANIRPPWKAAHVPGVLEDCLLGVAVDGTITGLALLDPALTHRLRWVQRLCERSKRVCPWLRRHMNNAFEGEMDKDVNLVVPPLGFGDERSDARRVRPEDMHIDGDVLLRLLQRGGAELLKQMILEETGRKDRVAEWVRQNLDSQLVMAEELIEEVRRTLDRWY